MLEPKTCRLKYKTLMKIGKFLPKDCEPGDVLADALVVVNLKFFDTGKVNGEVLTLDGRKMGLGGQSAELSEDEEFRAWILMGKHLLDGEALRPVYKQMVRSTLGMLGTAQPENIPAKETTHGQ